LPQAIAESSVNPFEYSMYIGLVTAALVAGVVALGALVAGLILRRRQTQLGISLGVPAWLPLVLLIPTAVHLSGIAYHQKQMEELESLSPEQVSAAETLPNQAVATDDAVE
jgi:cytochrome bd-type quinol oxidase subunit 1